VCVCVCVCMCICICMCMCMCMCVCLRACGLVCMYVCACGHAVYASFCYRSERSDFQLAKHARRHTRKIK